MFGAVATLEFTSLQGAPVTLEHLGVYCNTSAKVLISSLYLLRHLGDRGQNYKTQVVVRIVYSSMTPDHVKSYGVSFFSSVIALLCTLCGTPNVLFAMLHGPFKLY